jgi:putative peptide zinc metalloprotease protein
MLAIRPTFSESWYRVKTLKAKLRASAQISRQFYRGERWYVVRDPAGNQFHRLSDAAYRFVGLLDGTRTVEEAWDLVGGHLADDAPTQPEVIQILTHLYSANLIDADVTPDATVLLRRHKKQRQQKMQGRLMNLLFPRIPLWDPDQFLVRWMPLVRHLFSRTGAIVWIVVIVAAIASVAPEWDRVKAATAHAIDMSGNPWNALWLWIVFSLIKFIHELGHAFSCRRFGGECHELGIMFLIFIPTPYVDASTAWSFPNKWHRIFVGAAGMIVELFVAALMAFVWLNTKDNTMIHELAYNAMLVASVTTVIFNANPLLRYDGYYILSDLLEIPNLRQKSTEYAMGIIKRHIFRVKLQQPLPPVRQRIELFTYAVTSTIYRTIIGIVIILVVTWQIPVLGVLMAIGGVATWCLVPSFKLFKYLTIDPELHRKRWRATLFCGATAMILITLIGIIRFSTYVDEEGIVEPYAKQIVVPRTDGVVTEIVAKDGEYLQKGDVILRMTNDELAATIVQLKQQLIGFKIRATKSSVVDQVQYQIDREAIVATQESLASYEKDFANLEIRAAIDGQLVAPRLDELNHMFLKRGTAIGQLSADGPLIVRAMLEQQDFQKLVDSKIMERVHGAKGSPVEVRLVGAVGTVLKGVSMTMPGAAQRELAHSALGQGGGGDIITDPTDRTGLKPLVEQFEARIVLNADETQFIAGQRAIVRFKTAKEPLIRNWLRRFRQLIISHQSSQWL